MNKIMNSTHAVLDAILSGHFIPPSMHSQLPGTPTAASQGSAMFSPFSPGCLGISSQPSGLFSPSDFQGSALKSPSSTLFSPMTSRPTTSQGMASWPSLRPSSRNEGTPSSPRSASRYAPHTHFCPSTLPIHDENHLIW